MKEFLKIEYWNNTMQDYMIFLAMLIVSLLFLLIIKVVVIRRLKKKAEKTETKWDDAIVQMLSIYIVPLIMIGIIYFSTNSLTMSVVISRALYVITLGLVLIIVAMALSKLFIFLINRNWGDKDQSIENSSAKWLGILIKVCVWSILILLYLDNLDIEISVLLAGLGVGGIAIAFALNTILQDLFSFVTIFFDRPFEIGDFINIGDMSGSVEHIGLKTTRIRSLSGEQLVFSNNDLTNSRIRNYKRMENRRVAYKIGVTYNTPSEKLRLIPSLISEIITSMDMAKFDRTHLKSFDDFSITYEVVYYVLSQDYALYMDVNQEINFKIKDVFEENEIEFAFPTQSIYLEKDD